MKTTCAAKLRGTDAVTHKEVGRIAQATPLSKHVMRTRVRLQVHVLRREVADTSRAVAYDSLYFPRTLRVKKKSPDQRLQQAGLDAALGQSQNRFRRWRSTTEPLFNFRRLQDLACGRQGQALGLIFLDWNKAADKVDSRCLLTVLRKVGVPESVTRVIAASSVAGASAPQSRDNSAWHTIRARKKGTAAPYSQSSSRWSSQPSCTKRRQPGGGNSRWPQPP